MASQNNNTVQPTEALWESTKALVSAGGVENMIELLMEQTGWKEKQARKYASMALKHCAVEFHQKSARKDVFTGIIWFVAGLLALAIIQAAHNYLHESFYIFPPLGILYGLYQMLRGLRSSSRCTKAARNLPVPPHIKP